MAVDEPHLQHRSLERAGADDVVDGLGLPQQLGDLPAIVAPEVRAHPGPEVGGLAHVEDPAPETAEEVHPGPPGEAAGQPELAHLGMGPDGRKLEQVIEAEDPEVARPLE